MDSANAQDIVDWPRPTNQKEVQQILGLWNCYRGFIPNYAQIVAPITDHLNRSGKVFKCGELQQAALFLITSY